MTSAPRSGRAADARRPARRSPSTWRRRSAWLGATLAELAGRRGVAAAHARRRAGPSPTRSATWPTSTRPRCCPSATRSGSAARPRRWPRAAPTSRTRSPPSTASSPARSCSLVPDRAAGLCWPVTRASDPAARLPWYGLDMGPAVVDHRPADGDLGARPGHRRRARRPRPATGRLRHVAHLGIRSLRPTATRSTACRSRAPPSASSWPRRTAASGPGGLRARLTGSAARRSTSAWSSPSGGTAPTRGWWSPGTPPPQWIGMAQAFAGAPGPGRKPLSADGPRPGRCRRPGGPVPGGQPGGTARSRHDRGDDGPRRPVRIANSPASTATAPPRPGRWSRAAPSTFSPATTSPS